LAATFPPLELPQDASFPNAFDITHATSQRQFRSRDLRDGLGNVQLHTWPEVASIVEFKGDVDPADSRIVRKFVENTLSFETYTSRSNEVFQIVGGAALHGELERRFARRVVTKNLGMDLDYLLVVSDDFGTSPDLPELAV
jgi:hypothetical protein